MAGEAGVTKDTITPQYVWPLGNTSMHHEVMRGHDAHLPDANQCFALQQGYPGIPYDAMVLTGSPTSYVDFHFSGEVNFRVSQTRVHHRTIASRPLLKLTSALREQRSKPRLPCVYLSLLSLEEVRNGRSEKGQ